MYQTGHIIVISGTDNGFNQPRLHLFSDLIIAPHSTLKLAPQITDSNQMKSLISLCKRIKPK